MEIYKFWKNKGGESKYIHLIEDKKKLVAILCIILNKKSSCNDVWNKQWKYVCVCVCVCVGVDMHSKWFGFNIF